MKGIIMFKLDDIVITPNEIPAVVTQILNNGIRYIVNEMPKLTIEEVQERKRAGQQFIPAVENNYSYEELRIPTVEEQELLTFLLDLGAAFPIVH